jgi:putative ABC transport system permease protein
MRALLKDLQYGLRMLAKTPGFAIVAILTLAMGIGANAAIFQLIDAVRLRTLPVKDPAQLAIVHIDKKHWGSGSFNGPYAEFSFPLWQQVQQRQQVFSSIAAWGGGGGQQINLARGGEVDMASVIWISGEFFQTLGVPPMVGRLISDGDDQKGCAGGVDISYAFWQRRYGGEASAIGSQITLDGHPFPILGVTPTSFYGVSVGDRFDIAVPVCAEPIINGQFSRITGERNRASWWLSVFGRLKPGMTLERASAQLGSIASPSLHETIPPQYDAEGVKHYLDYAFQAWPAENGFSQMRKDTSDPLWLMLGLSGLVLLIACANLANLLLARASTREREVAVRLAMGASRARLIRQMLSESALLAIAGAICGGFLAAGLSRALIAFIATPENPVFLDMPTDWRVLGFAAGLAVLTTVLFGLAPALRAGNVPIGSVLKMDGRGMTAGRKRFRFQRILVASQVALSLVLLAGALLFAHSLRNLMTRDPGFQQDGVLVADIDFTRLNVPTERQYPFTQDLLDRIRAIPGVAAAAASNRSPINGNTSNDWILDDKGNHSNDHNGWAYEDYVSPGYFQTIENPMLAGRDFNSNDTATSPPVAIVNQTFAKQFFKGAKDALGKRFRVWAPPGEQPRYYTVVGEVKDSVYNDMHDPMTAVMYFPRTQLVPPFVYPGATLLIRSHAGIAGVLNPVKETIAGQSSEIDIHFKVLRTQIHESLAQDELIATLCGFFGALAVLLAAVGLYGVISYTVAQRTNEIGIRMALGAQRSGVVRLVLGEVAILIGIGVVVGTGLTLAGGKAATSLLYGLAARDPVTLVSAAILLAIIGFAASFVPAQRATRVDPMVALRYE